MKRLFGTNGIRGTVNEDMTVELAAKVGRAAGRFMKGTVAIASDTRVSRDMIKQAVSAGLMASGCNVIDLGTIPTPALQYFVKIRTETVGGIMITASHNPPNFNGIKCVSSDGTEMSREDEEAIETNYYNDDGDDDVRIGRMRRETGAEETYIDAVISNVDADAIRAAGLRAVLDCANGASYATAPLLLKKLNVKTRTLNADAQGEFPGHDSEPTEENLKDLIEMMRRGGSDIGIAHDGDADRTVFVSAKGEYVSGDKSLALIAASELARKKGTVVTPVSSSSMVEEVIVAAGGKVKYTAVGSPIVARTMMTSDAIFGGEENGGLIFPDMQFCRDGAMTVAKMLEAIVKNGPLSKQIKTLPVYHTYKFKIECDDEGKEKLMKIFAREKYDNSRKDKTDGIKLIYDNGWVLLRPSGTEPIFRIYSESKEMSVAKARGEEFVGRSKEYLVSK